MFQTMTSTKVVRVISLATMPVTSPFYVVNLASCKSQEPNESSMGKAAVIAYVNSKGSGEPAHLRSLARTFAVRARKQ